MSQAGDAWSNQSLVVMLDWENFPGIRPSSQPLPLEPILEFLGRNFHVRSMLAYAHRSTLSVAWEKRLEELGFELRLLDTLIDPNDKKNSLDLCLAMEAVRLSYTAAPEVYALLVAGDKDFAVVSAFIKQRLGRKILGFGSLYCPNAALAETVDRYFLLDHLVEWDHQLLEGTGSLPRPKPSKAKIKRAEQVRPLLEAAIADLGPNTPMPLGLLTPAMQRFDPSFQTHNRIKLSSVVELLGCELSEDRQAVVRWEPELVDSARRRAGWPEGIAWEGRHVTDWELYQTLVACVGEGLAVLAPTLRFPLPLSVLQTAIQKRCPGLRGILGKRHRLWHILEDMGFQLTDDHKAALGPRHGAHDLVELLDVASSAFAEPEPAEPSVPSMGGDIFPRQGTLPLDPPRGPLVGHQLALGFEPPQKSYSTLFEERREERIQALVQKSRGLERAAAALHARIKAEQEGLPPGPLFARLSGQPRQKALPFHMRLDSKP